METECVQSLAAEEMSFAVSHASHHISLCSWYVSCQLGPPVGKLYVFLTGASEIKVHKVDLLGIYSQIYASSVISQSTELLFCASMWFSEAAKLYFNLSLYLICHLAEMYR